jgi:glycosyltransferase involved in cell wall biosynthesis
MKLSIYTFVKDGIYFDFHVVAMLKHHLPFADEIIVNEGYSTDSTYEQIKDLDPKIRISRNRWDRSDPEMWYVRFKDQARRLCTGDWCILLDCDEFIPEWEFGHIREYLANAQRTIIPMRYVHFYGSYRVFNTRPEAHGWPVYKQTIHRNVDKLEIWGDGSNVRVQGDLDPPATPDVDFVCHHFGFVRNPARLRQKWRIMNRIYRQRKKRDWAPGFLFNLMPHDWFDEEYLKDLAIYDGPLIKAVTGQPEEFVRDENALYHYLSRRKAVGHGS